MPLKPTLLEGVDVDVVNGIATDARTVTAGRCLCHKHNDSASCLGVTMHATDCIASMGDPFGSLQHSGAWL